ncbi:MAG: TonB-dependent receptor family protein, partial [Prevotellaceae bacterium]|nr:TonB-dependent receptor family protein [Prevotellaceae bacterium]
MNKCIFLPVLLIVAATVEAQNITGKAVNAENKPVENATVVMQTPDSVYIGSACTDSAGIFRLTVDAPSYRLIVQHLLYETFENLYSGDDSPVVRLTERENSLDGIVIKSERPVVKLIDGKMTYDMPHLLSGKVVNNAYEAMLQLPGVREQNGLPALAGANGVAVIINGKVTSMPPENLMAALKMYPADNIQSAEVMYSAPPQYHVRGAAINLVLKDAESENSLQGQTNAAYTQKHYAGHSEGISLLFAAPALTADVNYSYSLNRSRSRNDFYSRHLFDGTIYDIEQFNRGDRKTAEHNIRMETDYKISGKSNISLTYTSQIRVDMDNNEASHGTVSNSASHKEENNPIQLHNLLMDYTFGSGFRTGAEYTFYKDNTVQHFVEKMTGKEVEFLANAHQNIHRRRLYVDKSHTLSRNRTLNYGVQYLHATDHSSQIYYSQENIDNYASNTDSRQTEHTADLYAGFEWSIGEKLSLSASLTGEYYRLNEYDEWTLFPAFEATYLVSPSHIVQLSVSSDKIYPSYWELHGAVGYINGYAEIHGNPLLKPYRDYSSQLSYILNRKYVFTLFYNYLDDYFNQLPYQMPNKLSLVYKTLNFNYKQTAGLNLTVPFAVGDVLNSRITLNGFYDLVKSSHFHDISFRKDNLVFYSRLDNTI